MARIRTGNAAHDATCQAAELTLLASVAAAGGNQATVNAAEIVFYRAVKTSMLANNVLPELGSVNLALKALNATPS